MDVQLRVRQIEEPKELGEVFDFVEGLINAIKKGESTAEKLSYATAELPKLVTAVDGFDKVKTEVKHEAVYEASGAFTGRLVKTLTK